MREFKLVLARNPMQICCQGNCGSVRFFCRDVLHLAVVDPRGLQSLIRFGMASLWHFGSSRSRPSLAFEYRVCGWTARLMTLITWLAPYCEVFISFRACRAAAVLGSHTSCWASMFSDPLCPNAKIHAEMQERLQRNHVCRWLLGSGPGKTKTRTGRHLNITDLVVLLRWFSVLQTSLRCPPHHGHQNAVNSSANGVSVQGIITYCSLDWWLRQLWQTSGSSVTEPVYCCARNGSRVKLWTWLQKSMHLQISCLIGWITVKLYCVPWVCLSTCWYCIPLKSNVGVGIEMETRVKEYAIYLYIMKMTT